MNTKTQHFTILFIIVAALLALTAGLSLAKDRPARFLETWQVSDSVGTGFTYQGQLTDGGTPAEGIFDLQFDLYDAEAGGTLIGTVTLEDVTVTEGIFTVALDFGTGAFDGDARWLAIGVRPGDDTEAFTPLTPRQALAAAPYALYATTAPWSGLTGIPAGLEDGDDDTTYAAGTALELDGTTFNVLTDTVQTRVTGTCAAGSMVTAVNADGTVVCETDDDTTYAAGTALELDGTTFNVLTDTLQTRVTGECAIGSTIQTINADGTVICEPHDTRPVFSRTALDTAGDVGKYTSITIGADGLPIISYYDYTYSDLKVAHCDNAACTSATITALDTAGNVGPHTSITIGADGLPIISYQDATNGNLKAAHCNDAACTGATITIVDTGGDVGECTSITIGADGLPIISYLDLANTDLKAAHCDDIACTGATITAVDTGGDVGWFTSITIGADGLPIISYYDFNNSGLKAAHCDNAACTSATTAALDTGGDVGWYTFITIGADGLPIISYYDWGNFDLKAAHCNDAACTSATTSALDTAGSVGWYTAITIGADSLPIISYFDDTNNNLKAAHCNDAACTSATLTTLDTAGWIGEYTSITIGADGLPIISYYDALYHALKVTHCSNTFCVPFFRRR